VNKQALLFQLPTPPNHAKDISFDREAPSYKVISLFAGCGGMDLGFIGGFKALSAEYCKLPFDIIWANEINPYACRTYRRNIGSHIHEGNIWDLINTAPKNADVVIGGFPCQDISINGKGAGVAGNRSGLYRAMVEMVKRSMPRIFIAENVKGLLMRSHAHDLASVVKDFSALGYHVSINLYNAADYGVPQTRERVFIVGVADSACRFDPPSPTHSKAAHITAHEAIHDLESVPEDDSMNHIWSRANKSPDQGNRKLVANRPGYTIRAECHGNIQWHYALHRRISMREAARIQSFPDTFIFESKLRETERQIGNAVPPVLAWHVGKSIAKTLIESDCQQHQAAA
jgi:DNA (cytosine-5)-methyltransferase 1